MKALEKAMAPHSSTLAWKIPWMEESGRLQSMGSQRVGHDWTTSLIWKLEGMGWFNPTNMGKPSKEGRGYTKRSLNSSTCLEVARPRKSTPTLCPWKRRNSLGSVNSKVGTWAPVYSLLTQEDRPNCLRLASLPSKSCSYCSPHIRCFKFSFVGKLFLPATKWNNS